MEGAFILMFLIISKRKGLFLFCKSTRKPPKDNSVKRFSAPLGYAVFLF